MKRLVTIAFSFAALVGFISAAEAKAYRYMSQHPLPKRAGHGFCYIDVPHMHDFGPSEPRAYRMIDGEYYFVGDPAAYDYDGPKYSYYGAHPIVDAQVSFGRPTYCYLRGPHYHWYVPPPEAQFELKGGAYWYVGTYDPVFEQERPHYAPVNEVYTSMPYQRPVVDVHVAPPAFHGEIVIGGPAVSAGLYIGSPPPVVVGGPPVVVERDVVYVEHDHGRHRGWHKHGGPPPGPPHGPWIGHPAPAPGPAPHGGWHGRPAPAPHGPWRPSPQPAPAPAHGGWNGHPAPAPAGGPHPAPSRGGAPHAPGWGDKRHR